jgi:hypothetical protein
MARVCKLLFLLAVLLMPFGMAPAAAGAGHHMVAADMPMGHCPNQDSGRHMKGGIAECTMACAGALPAVDLASQQPIRTISPVAATPLTERLHGLHPDTETPPPKPS